MYRKSERKKARCRYPLVFLSSVLLVFMFSVLPAQADTCSAYTVTLGSDLYGTVYSAHCVVLGHNTTQGFETDLPYTISANGSSQYTCTYYVPNDGCTWGIQISFTADQASLMGVDYTYNTSITTSGSYSGCSPTTATNAANTAASNASTAAGNASTAATNASTAAANASNAYTAATAAQTAANSANTNASTAANNTAYGGQSAAYWADNANSNAANANANASIAAGNTTYNSQSAAYWANSANSNASTAATNAANANTNASTAANQATSAASNTTYGGQSAAYWANQAATAAISNIVPAISNIIGQNGATCTTGTSFVANVAVSPASSITYTATGVPSYTVSGNSITFTGLSSGAYTAIITATYTPTGKTCTFPFTFFKI